MPRLNIYIPEDLHDALQLHRDRMNLSEICTKAIRSELKSITTGAPRPQPRGSAEWLRSNTESELARHYDLRHVRVVPCAIAEATEAVGKAVAEFVDALVRDGMHIAMGGGAQLSAAVNHLRPRNVRAMLSAIGFGHVDREVPHVHANLVATRVSLLYARSDVILVGDPRLRERWPVHPEKSGEDVMRLIIGGCGRWERDSALGRMLGPEICDVLDEKKVVGDYLGVFLGDDGQPVEPYLPSAPVSSLGSADLYAYARRRDTLVVLVASSFMKTRTIKKALQMKLCNALVLDEETASVLISHAQSGIR